MSASKEVGDAFAYSEILEFWRALESKAFGIPRYPGRQATVSIFHEKTSKPSVFQEIAEENSRVREDIKKETIRKTVKEFCEVSYTNILDDIERTDSSTFPGLEKQSSPDTVTCLRKTLSQEDLRTNKYSQHDGFGDRTRCGWKFTSVSKYRRRFEAEIRKRSMPKVKRRSLDSAIPGATERGVLEFYWNLQIQQRAKRNWYSPYGNSLVYRPEVRAATLATGNPADALQKCTDKGVVSIAKWKKRAKDVRTKLKKVRWNLSRDKIIDAKPIYDDEGNMNSERFTLLAVNDQTEYKPNTPILNESSPCFYECPDLKSAKWQSENLGTPKITSNVEHELSENVVRFFKSQYEPEHVWMTCPPLKSSPDGDSTIKPKLNDTVIVSDVKRQEICKDGLEVDNRGDDVIINVAFKEIKRTERDGTATTQEIELCLVEEESSLAGSEYEDLTSVESLDITTLYCKSTFNKEGKKNDTRGEVLKSNDTKRTQEFEQKGIADQIVDFTKPKDREDETYVEEIENGPVNGSQTSIQETPYIVSPGSEESNEETDEEEVEVSSAPHVSDLKCEEVEISGDHLCKSLLQPSSRRNSSISIDGQVLQLDDDTSGHTLNDPDDAVSDLGTVSMDSDYEGVCERDLQAGDCEETEILQQNNGEKIDAGSQGKETQEQVEFLSDTASHGNEMQEKDTDEVQPHEACQGNEPQKNEDIDEFLTVDAVQGKKTQKAKKIDEILYTTGTEEKNNTLSDKSEYANLESCDCSTNELPEGQEISLDAGDTECEASDKIIECRLEEVKMEQPGSTDDLASCSIEEPRKSDATRVNYSEEFSDFDSEISFNDSEASFKDSEDSFKEAKDISEVIIDVAQIADSENEENILVEVMVADDTEEECSTKCKTARDHANAPVCQTRRREPTETPLPSPITPRRQRVDDDALTCCDICRVIFAIMFVTSVLFIIVFCEMYQARHAAEILKSIQDRNANRAPRTGLFWVVIKIFLPYYDDDDTCGCF